MDDDTIYRQAAILALVHEQSWNMHEDQRTAIGVIADLPPVDAQRWIPVTERLPELYTDVLLSCRQSYSFGEPDNWCVVGELIDKVDITWATNYGFHDILYSNDKHTVWVSAWMPLPEPYKGGDDD